MGMNNDYTGPCDIQRDFPNGCLVRVLKGKYTETDFMVVGAESEDTGNVRVLIADGLNFSGRNPKRKNPKHLTRCGTVSKIAADRISAGKSLDDGWLRDQMRSLMK